MLMADLHIPCFGDEQSNCLRSSGELGRMDGSVPGREELYIDEMG